MIVNEQKSAGVCNAYYSAMYNEVGPLIFDNASLRRFAYIFTGSGVLSHDALGVSQTFSSGDLIDFRAFSEAGECSVEVTSENCLWVAFYAKDVSDKFEATLMSAGSVSLTGGAFRESILVLRDSITANGKTISEKQFAMIPADTVVSVEVPDGALCVHLKRTK